MGANVLKTLSVSSSILFHTIYNGPPPTGRTRAHDLPRDSPALNWLNYSNPN